MDHGTFLYDGDCAFCSACARFVERRIPTPARVVPWQFADLDALGVTAAECEAAVQWIAAPVSRSAAAPIGVIAGVTPTGATAAGPDAIAALLRTSGPVWRAAGAVLGLRPVRALAWPVYRWVARNRHRMPGGTPACSLPRRAETP